MEEAIIVSAVGGLEEKLLLLPFVSACVQMEKSLLQGEHPFGWHQVQLREGLRAFPSSVS